MRRGIGLGVLASSSCRASCGWGRMGMEYKAFGLGIKKGGANEVCMV